ncbi:DUF2271 domain-containing protein [Winogradskyella endarachnes]|uniref:DUF2271 domain-containing protein n=1 Tax=Winogradskyella endarachnes TaxID=2681965 RepID=A0A6L6UD07_9FLAO|nr:DUF2271 domain-containing protein [Winogradskyella endarachnes]MUU79416.1 DUF2271 domain-containing protein [Winogradskyella endarachnes]
MKNIKLISLLSILVLGLVSFTTFNESTKYKCMIQMTNYTGEGAYIVISLLNSEGEYVETLNVKGDDDEWYNTVESWWQFYGKRRPNIDAITGATISGGERAITVIEIDDNKLDKGYKLRFETAVEDQEYYESDVELELTSANVKSKVEGTGFIRYIRLMAQ